MLDLLFLYWLVLCYILKLLRNRISNRLFSGGGPVHARVPIHAHPLISPKQSQLHNKLPMYMINLIIIYDLVNIFSMKNYKSSRKLGVGLNWYPGVN